MKHVLFVYNPVAGAGRIRKQLFEIVDFYDSNDYMVTLCPIRRIHDYYPILKLDENLYDLIVCSGGDGTLNLMMSFFKQVGIEACIGYVPSGSTNDYAYSLGISDDFWEAMKRTIYGEKRRIDIGQFNNSYFLYVAAFGIFTKAAYSTSQKAKNVLGYAAYILEGIKQISDLKAYHMVIETEHEKVDDVFVLGLITNSLSVGGIKNLIPDDVAMDDGMFETIFIKKPSNLLELKEIVWTLWGEDLNANPNIIYTKSQKVTVQAQEEIEWTLDGEYGGSYQEINITNLQKELTIIV